MHDTTTISSHISIIKNMLSAISAWWLVSGA